MRFSLPCTRDIQLRKLYFGYHNVAVPNLIRIFSVSGVLYLISVKTSFGIVLQMLLGMT